MDEQRAQEEERKAAAEAEQIALREQQKTERMAEMEQKAQEVKAECGATWSFCFDSCGKPYAVGGGAGFISLSGTVCTLVIASVSIITDSVRRSELVGSTCFR